MSLNDKDKEYDAESTQKLQEELEIANGRKKSLYDDKANNNGIIISKMCKM